MSHIFITGSSGRRGVAPVNRVGHVTGAGGAYRTAARAADQRVRRLMGAVRSRRAHR